MVGYSDSRFRTNAQSVDPMEMERARFELLATLPIPTTVPDDVLKPILIPAPFTIHEFLGNTGGVSSYHIIVELS